MLKRQRPPSPPPFVPSIPLVDDSYPDATRDVKRRRILPPSLDGKSRDWSIPDIPDDDDDEDYDSQHEKAKPYGIGLTMDSADYKQANTVLHELHTLHQHRLLFTSTHDSGSQVPTLSQCLPQHAQSNHDDVSSKMIITPHPEVSGCDYSNSTYPNSHPSVELERVTQRYGDTNRLLGSLFLSRRRQLGSAEETR
ncbi:hypothetical protein E4T56_gene13289 [Termitomyces sp. T112]|nr:hypothetical protein C0989_011087 [Termitomyces sp. Mn162]KAG5719337.1 hypothetical protein E4T56_gene13289 [Termitomyces sp. T112]KAH0590431.1 hypothetical protein H2248_000584 [Termitomyces sp. 'cryptogamus']